MQAQRALLTGQDMSVPFEPLVLEGPRARLVVRLALGWSLIFLILEEHSPAAHPLESAVGLMRLTRRETEVLRWMAEGKTNGEIGVILGISLRTVDKHVERIFGKLNVPTRTAAVPRGA
jgi:DNA-binding CsgD family transcriptional regulator